MRRNNNSIFLRMHAHHFLLRVARYIFLLISLSIYVYMMCYYFVPIFIILFSRQTAKCLSVCHTCSAICILHFAMLCYAMYVCMTGTVNDDHY